jgi:nitrate/nitrite transporter NarK
MQVELVWIAVMAFGLGWGGVYTILQLTVMESFGLKAAGKILGTITIMDALGGGLGIWLTGVLYSTFGSYDIAFRIFVVLICIAIVSATQIRPVMQAPAPVHQPS